MLSFSKNRLTRFSAMMSSISEAWTIMNKHMGMSYDDIGKVFEKWSSEGELVR
jgi:6-phosphogluconate dehydrogenase